MPAPPTAAPPTQTVAGSVPAQDIVTYATQPQFLGTRYVDHATIPNWGPGTGWDCSSYTSYVMKKYGVDLPAYSDAQYKMGTPVGKADLKPGDLVFFHNSSSGGKTTGHVGLYIGDGKMVNAANPSAGTVVQNVTWGTYVGARRYINTSGSATVPKGTPTSSTTDHAGDSPTVSAQYTGQPPAGQDHLNLNDAVAVQEFNMDFVKSHPAILRVFQQAVDEDWFTTGGAVGKAKFVAAIQATPWAKANGSFAQAWILRSASAPPVVVAEERTAAAQFVRDAALRVGAKLTPEQEAFFANQVLLNGWNADAGRAHFLDQALTGQLELTDPTTAGKSDVFQTDFLNYEGGAAARTMQTLKDSAYKNGLTFSADWYRGAARAVQSGLGNIADYQQEIRTKAASMFPVFSDRVAAGADVMDLASPYINKMASTLEIDPNAITLNDPTIKQAMGGMDAKGNPTAMGLWDFERSLKQDRRWQYTKQANDQADGLISRLGTLMGFEG